MAIAIALSPARASSGEELTRNRREKTSGATFLLGRFREQCHNKYDGALAV
jgi:hypothetical protein